MFTPTQGFTLGQHQWQYTGISSSSSTMTSSTSKPELVVTAEGGLPVFDDADDAVFDDDSGTPVFDDASPSNSPSHSEAPATAHHASAATSAVSPVSEDDQHALYTATSAAADALTWVASVSEHYSQQETNEGEEAEEMQGEEAEEMQGEEVLMQATLQHDQDVQEGYTNAEEVNVTHTHPAAATKESPTATAAPPAGSHTRDPVAAELTALLNDARRREQQWYTHSADGAAQEKGAAQGQHTQSQQHTHGGAQHTAAPSTSTTRLEMPGLGDMLDGALRTLGIVGREGAPHGGHGQELQHGSNNVVAMGVPGRGRHRLRARRWVEQQQEGGASVLVGARLGGVRQGGLEVDVKDTARYAAAL